MKSLKDCKRIFIGVVCLLHGIAVADTTEIFVRLNSDPFAAPHYIFSNTENGDAITPELVRGFAYVFTRTDSGHALNIGSGWRTADSNLTISSTGTDYAVSDVASIENGQKLTVQIPSDFSGSTITYYCYLHSSMVSTISVVDPAPVDPNTVDTDSDGIPDMNDADDDGDGYSDEQEAIDGTDPLSRFSCRSGCFSFDVDQSSSLNALTDGLLVMRHLFDFSGDTLVANATDTSATRSVASDISSYLTDARTELDIDGSGDVGALTDGLLLIRYLFDFRGESLISNALDANATRKTAEDIEAYIAARVPES